MVASRKRRRRRAQLALLLLLLLAAPAGSRGPRCVPAGQLPRSAYRGLQSSRSQLLMRVMGRAAMRQQLGRARHWVQRLAASGSLPSSSSNSRKPTSSSSSNNSSREHVSRRRRRSSQPELRCLHCLMPSSAACRGRPWLDGCSLRQLFLGHPWLQFPLRHWRVLRLLPHLRRQPAAWLRAGARHGCH